MGRTLLTVGDEKRTIDELIRLLREAHVGVRVDVRTCFERHPDDCHRGILAARWRARGSRAAERWAPDG